MEQLPEIKNNGIIGTKLLSEMLGLTPVRIQQLCREGILPYTLKGRLYKFDLVETIKAWTDYLRKQAREKEQAAESDPDIRLKNARAAKLEMEVQEMRGKMYRADDIEAIWNDHILKFRSLLMALPGQMAVDCSEAGSAAECSEIIKAGIYRVLQTMSEYEYDPEEYEERIRKRHGWDSDQEEEE